MELIISVWSLCAVDRYVFAGASGHLRLTIAGRPPWLGSAYLSSEVNLERLPRGPFDIVLAHRLLSNRQLGNGPRGMDYCCQNTNITAPTRIRVSRKGLEKVMAEYDVTRQISRPVRNPCQQRHWLSVLLSISSQVMLVGFAAFHGSTACHSLSVVSAGRQQSYTMRATYRWYFVAAKSYILVVCHIADCHGRKKSAKRQARQARQIHALGGPWPNRTSYKATPASSSSTSTRKP
ncbi:hypothetical protein GGS20DRAFT_562610 [Poronia punctata]|nr:hypothetical protein GGS20DRAFT_562610 [Poronia punctata]